MVNVGSLWLILDNYGYTWLYTIGCQTWQSQIPELYKWRRVKPCLTTGWRMIVKICLPSLRMIVNKIFTGYLFASTD